MDKPLKSSAKPKAKSNDLFAAAEPKGRAPAKAAAREAGAEAGYTAADIEVLEGLEPVRRRPGMYIGGTDEKALHHLFAEVIDNSMDEALAGHASFIEVELSADGFLTVTDNGRGFDTAGKNSGIGLRAIGENAASMGGNASITSGPNGTKIRVSLPCAAD